MTIHSLAVTITRNDASGDRLQQASHLPCCRPSFGMAEETLLRNDWYCISWRTRYFGENFIPDAGFVFLLRVIVLQGEKLGKNKSQHTFAFVLVPWIDRTPISSAVRPQTASARRSGAIRGSVPSSIPYIAKASFSCRTASFSMSATRDDIYPLSIDPPCAFLNSCSS